VVRVVWLGWEEPANEHGERQLGEARRDELTAFVEGYRKVRDDLARETADWDVDARRRYMYEVLRALRWQRRPTQTKTIMIKKPRSAKERRGVPLLRPRAK
jgi:hypothetical protein